MDWGPQAQRTAAEALLSAYRTRRPIASLTERFSSLTLAQAYDVQMATVAAWTAEGARVVGKKIGLTSKAAQAHFGAHEPDQGPSPIAWRGPRTRGSTWAS